MDRKICQSCGMPLATNEDCGTNNDGSLNSEYCTYCFKDGQFTRNCTMDEMIQACLQYLSKFNQNSEKQFSEEEAIAQMNQFFPMLKRWKN